MEGGGGQKLKLYWGGERRRENLKRKRGKEDGGK